jgi:hypothetical protein
MKASKFLISLATLAACSGVYADESATNFNLGPSLFMFRGQADALNASTDDQGIYCGARGEFVYAKKEGFYASLLGVYAPGASTTTHNFENLIPGMKATTLKIATHLWQGEAKLGKHYISNFGASIVPYLAGGVYNVYSSISVGFPAQPANDATAPPTSFNSTSNMRWWYGAVGLIGSYPVHPNADIALNAKLMRHLSITNKLTQVDGTTASSSLPSGWGYEISLPIKVRMGESKNWNTQIEPFFLKIDTSQAVNVFGARLSLQKGF